jgi:hypothetical protein
MRLVPWIHHCGSKQEPSGHEDSEHVKKIISNMSVNEIATQNDQALK